MFSSSSPPTFSVKSMHAWWSITGSSDPVYLRLIFMTTLRHPHHLFFPLLCLPVIGNYLNSPTDSPCHILQIQDLLRSLSAASVGFSSISADQPELGRWGNMLDTAAEQLKRVLCTDSVHFNTKSNNKWFVSLVTSPDRMKRIAFSIYCCIPSSTLDWAETTYFLSKTCWGNPKCEGEG